MKESRLEARNASNAAISKVEEIAATSSSSEKKSQMKITELESQILEMTNSLRQNKMAKKSEERKHISEINKLETLLQDEKTLVNKLEKNQARLQSELQSSKQFNLKLKDENNKISLIENEKAEVLINEKCKQFEKDLENKTELKINKYELLLKTMKEEEDIKISNAYRKGELIEVENSEKKLKAVILKNENEKNQIINQYHEEKIKLLSLIEVNSNNLNEIKQENELLIKEKESLTHSEVKRINEKEEIINSLKLEYENKCDMITELQGFFIDIEKHTQIYI